MVNHGESKACDKQKVPHVLWRIEVTRTGERKKLHVGGKRLIVLSALPCLML